MQELEIQTEKRILIISPHPDDETFCCSGILMNYAEQCDVVLLTDGSMGNPEWSKGRTARVRQKEFHKVMRFLGVHKYIEFGIADGTLEKNTKFLCKIPYERYDYIFVPNRYDEHRDHKCVYAAVRKACRWRRSHAQLFEYEMWGTLRSVTHYVDISDSIKRKRELMALYESQKVHIDYSARIQALNYYRAISLKRTDYIECFYSQEHM